MSFEVFKYVLECLVSHEFSCISKICKRKKILQYEGKKRGGKGLRKRDRLFKKILNNPKHPSLGYSHKYSRYF